MASLLLCLPLVYIFIFQWSTVKRLYTEIEIEEKSRFAHYILGLSLTPAVNKKGETTNAATKYEKLLLLNYYATRAAPKTTLMSKNRNGCRKQT